MVPVYGFRFMYFVVRYFEPFVVRKPSPSFCSIWAYSVTFGSALLREMTKAFCSTSVYLSLARQVYYNILYVRVTAWRPRCDDCSPFSESDRCVSCSTNVQRRYGTPQPPPFRFVSVKLTSLFLRWNEIGVSLYKTF